MVKTVNLSLVLLFHYLKRGSFGMDVHTPLCLKWVIMVEHRQLCSMVRSSLDGREFGENGYTYVYD